MSDDRPADSRRRDKHVIERDRTTVQSGDVSSNVRRGGIATRDPSELRTEIVALRKKLGIVGGIVRCDIGDPEFDGEAGDLRALEALNAYLGRRSRAQPLRPAAEPTALPSEVVKAAEAE